MLNFFSAHPELVEGKNLQAVGSSSRFLLILFLLLPTATQCMEIVTAVKPKSIQEIKKDRDNIIKKSFTASIEIPFYNAIFLINWNQNDFFLKNYNSSFIEKHYSFLGLTAIAILSPLITEEISFSEKNTRIKRLLQLNFIPTPKDKEFALLEKYERCAPSIIRKLCTFQHSPLLSEIEVPQDIISYISLLMWQAEESLL